MISLWVPFSPIKSFQYLLPFFKHLSPSHSNTPPSLPFFPSTHSNPHLQSHSHIHRAFSFISRKLNKNIAKMVVGVDSETKFHVLAVDDSIIDRKLIERLLKTSSYQVTVVESGVKAIEYLGLLDEDNTDTDSETDSVSMNKNHNEVEVNLIITDYSMPGITGYDLLRKIKESRSFRDVPVVIMSSENVPSRINSCLEHGAEEFFLKPVQMSDVNKLRPCLMRGRCKDVSLVNKRKPVEECLSPDRTRTRFNDAALELVQ